MRTPPGNAIVLAIAALILSAGAPAVPAVPGAAPQEQQQNPETRAGGGERVPNENGQELSVVQRPSYPPTDLTAAALERFAAPATPGLATGLAGVAQTLATRGSAAAALYARQHGIDWRAGAVRVRVDTGLPRRGVSVREASSRALVEQVLAEVSARGGRVQRVFGPHIEAWIPAGELAGLALQPAVRGIDRPWKMRADVTSEGVEVIGGDVWQNVRFRSPTDGLDVGVIDLSFTGYASLRGSELPPQDRLMTRSFREDGDMEAGDEHGTAVAEIVYDLQQEGTLYLVAVETLGDIDEAITYLINNGVDVINMSLGCVGCAPGDGRGSAIEVVERAPQAGIPFATSAGNEADRHWIGTFSDPDNDGLNNFAPGDETESFSGDAGDEVSITMNWDFTNWFASSEDLDLILLDAQGRVVDQSRNRQAGFSGQEAVEEIFITLPFSGTFHVVVENIQTSSPQEFELFVEANGLEYVVAEKSLSVPADGNQVIAVGATRWSNDVPEAFSSRGPTKDGRMKPDLAAPDGVSTASFGPMNFFGTSAASPHVVGAVALLRGRLGLLSGDDALDVIWPRLIDLPPIGPDNITGAGRLSIIPPG